MFTLILFVFLILLLDAVVSASEAAIYSVPLHRAQFLASKHTAGKSLLALKEAMELPITTLIALSNIITIVGSVFAGIIASEIFGEALLGVFAAVLTFLIMVFGEIAPKRLGESFAEQVALFVAPGVFVVSKVFSPISKLIVRITSPFHVRKKKTISEEEIRFLAEIAGKEGSIEKDEEKLIGRVFRLNDISTREIMTPKTAVDFIDGQKTVGETAELIKTAKHSRFPVFEGDKNNITGIVHQRNLLIALASGDGDQPVKNYAWDAMMVPDSRLVDDLLRDMRHKRAQLAVVVSDYGNIVGVVGIEDILEELVGEIIDEKDVAPELIKRVSRNEIIAHGQTRIPYVNHFFNTNIRSRRNLNGFLLDKLGSLPAEGAVFEQENLKFITEAVGPAAIDRVKIIKKEE